MFTQGAGIYWHSQRSVWMYTSENCVLKIISIQSQKSYFNAISQKMWGCMFSYMWTFLNENIIYGTLFQGFLEQNVMFWRIWACKGSEYQGFFNLKMLKKNHRNLLRMHAWGFQLRCYVIESMNLHFKKGHRIFWKFSWEYIFKKQFIVKYCCSRKH